jgi:hypothetical protein
MVEWAEWVECPVWEECLAVLEVLGPEQEVQVQEEQPISPAFSLRTPALEQELEERPPRTLLARRALEGKAPTLVRHLSIHSQRCWVEEVEEPEPGLELEWEAWEGWEDLTHLCLVDLEERVVSAVHLLSRIRVPQRRSTLLSSGS